MKAKQILLIIFALLIVFYLGYNFRTGSFKTILTTKATEILQEEHHSPPPVVIEPGSAVEVASYIIFKDDEGWVYAKNGITGAIEFSNTNASDVINNAISNLSTTGSYKHPYDVTTDVPKIVVRSPLTIDSSVTIDRPLILDLGWQAITLNAGFILPSKTTAVTIQNGGFLVASDVTAFDLTAVQNVVLSNLHFQQITGRYTYAINIDSDATASSNFGRLENILIAYADTGISIAGNAVSGYATEFQLSNVQVDSAKIAINLDYSQSIALDEITVGDSDVGVAIKGGNLISVRHLDVERSSVAHILFNDSIVYPSAATSQVMITHGFFGENKTATMVAVAYDAAATQNVGYVTFEQPNFWVEGQNYFTDTWHFYDFYFYQPLFGSSGTSFPTLSQVSHKYFGRFFERSGSWGGISPVYVVHGLAGTPTNVQISVNAVQPYATSWTANSTHITIYHNGAGSLSGNWEARYNP